MSLALLIDLIFDLNLEKEVLHMFKVVVVACLVASLPAALVYKALQTLMPDNRRRAKKIMFWIAVVLAWLSLVFFIISRN